MNPLWSLDALAEATGGRPLGDMPQSVSGISIDTRTLTPGDAYFAIKGERLDGHDFLSDAMKAGAGLAVVSEKKLVALGRVHIPMLVVRDVLQALRDLGAAARARTRATIIAITGSAGKTTTKEMLRTALAPAGRIHASAASFNNHWGVPLSLARMPADTQFGLFEIGMNHGGEIRPLTGLVKPNIAMITNIAPAHIGSFDSVEGIARAKAEIFEGVVRGGKAVIERDGKYFKLLATLAREAGIETVWGFGIKRGAEVRITQLEGDAHGSDVTVQVASERVSFHLAIPGEHMAYNAAGALGVAVLAGVDPADAARGLERARPASRRGERHTVPLDKGSFTVIDESYNANPASVAAALAVLRRTPPGEGGRRIAVLGDMLELGTASARLHKELRLPIAESGCDSVYLAGPEMRALADDLDPGILQGYHADAESLGLALAESVRAGDVVMVKASNGLKFSKVVSALLAMGGGHTAEV